MALYSDYATVPELKSYLRIPTEEQGGDDVDDAELALALTAASRAIDRTTNRQFGLAGEDVARLYTPEWDTVRLRWTVAIDDLMTVTDLVVKADLDDDQVYEETITDYRLIPLNAAGDGRPWTDLILGSTVSMKSTAEIQITATWGWTTVPAAIENACLIQASRFFKRREAPFGVAGSPDLGSEMRLFAKVDPDVQVMVGPYRRWWGAV
jgi:hypothetical protein